MTRDQHSIIWAILLANKYTGITFIGLQLKVKRAYNVTIDECFSEMMAIDGFLVSEEGGLLFPCRDKSGEYVDYGIPKLFQEGI